MKRYVRHTWKIYENEKNFEHSSKRTTSLYIGDGTKEDSSLSSSFKYSLLAKLRAKQGARIPSLVHKSSGTWKITELSARLWDRQNFSCTTQSLYMKRKLEHDDSHFTSLGASLTAYI